MKSVQDLRATALKLAALGATVGVGGEATHEAQNAAVMLARLIAKHPEIMCDDDEIDNEPVENFEPGEEDVIDKVIDRLWTKFQANPIDLRPTCVVCKRKSDRLRYGKCINCCIRIVKNK